MRFDDRLQTLLAAPVADNRDRAVRWRQLVDLLSRTAGEGGATVDAALELVRRDAFALDEGLRAATLRAIAGRALPQALLAILALQPVRIAAPVFAGLRLSAAEAAAILSEADDEVRALVEVDGAVEPTLPEAEPTTAPAEPAPSISAMVDRIEQLKQERMPAPAAAQRRRAASPGMTQDAAASSADPAASASAAAGTSSSPASQTRTHPVTTPTSSPRLAVRSRAFRPGRRATAPAG